MVLTTLVIYLVVYAALILSYMGVITYMAFKAAKGDPLPKDERSKGGQAMAIPAE
jgi:cytochrome bd ubiquinol oxidase subunit I